MLIELHQNVSQWTAKYKNPGSGVGEASCMQGIFPLFFFLIPLTLPSDSRFEPAVIDGRCGPDKAMIGWQRARWRYQIVSHR